MKKRCSVCKSMTEWVTVAQPLSLIRAQNQRDVRIRLGFCGSIYCFGLIQEHIPTDERTLFFVSSSAEEVQCSSCSKVTSTEVWLIFKVTGFPEATREGLFPDNHSNLIDSLPKNPTPFIDYKIDQSQIYDSLNWLYLDRSQVEEDPEFFEENDGDYSPELSDDDFDDSFIETTYRTLREFHDDISDCMVGPNYMFNSLPKSPHRTYWSARFDDEYTDDETFEIDIELPDDLSVEDETDDFDPEGF